MENNSLKLNVENGKFIAYRYIKAKSTKNYLIFFIHGYADEMREEKEWKWKKYAKNLMST